MRLLLVEDDELDVLIFKRALQETGPSCTLTLAREGEEALACLRGSTEHPPLPRPFIILLDLNLPRMKGLTFLETLRGEPGLRDAVVFVLSSSNAYRDRRRAYALNVAGYLPKFGPGGDAAAIVRLLAAYWQTVMLP